MSRKLSWCVISFVCLFGFLKTSWADDPVEINGENIQRGRQLIMDFYNNYTTSSTQQRTNPVDLVFVLDRSASVTRAGWQSMVRFVHNFLEHFTVDASNTRVAVITYGTTASIDIDGIGAGNYNKCALITRLQKHLALKIPSGYSATHEAIIKAKDVVVDSRQEAKKAVIVITDGKSNIGPPPVRASVQLRSLVWDPEWDTATKGPQLQIYAFGIKDAYMPEVRTIASPLPNHTFYIPSFQAFSELARSLHNDSQSENWQVLADKGYCNQVNDCSDNAYCACGTRSGLYVCVCKDGYQGDGNTCTACPRGMYKNTISPLRCHSCPANSTTLSEGATDALQCVCESPLYQEASGRPCHVKYCGQLPEISHGRKFHVAGRVVDEVSDTGAPCTNTPDTSCHYQCHEGYRLNGHPGLVCSPNGTWEGAVPECQIVDCSTLNFHQQEIQNGDVEYLNGTTTYGSWLRVRCREGYRAFGDSERNCTQHGDWSGTRTWCVENKCRALPLTPGLIITPVICGQSALVPGSVCTFLCERGYELSGPTNVTCTDQGAWDGTAETLCADVEPPAITCPDDLTTHMTRANYAEVHLPPGGARVSDNSNRFTVEAVGVVGDGSVNLTAGVHQIKYVARDRAGNEAQCFQTITVVETIIHVVTCPNETLHIQMIQHMSEVVLPEVAFADHNNATVGHSCVPANNSLLPMGLREIMCVPAVQTVVRVSCQFKVNLMPPKCTMPPAPLHGSVTCSPTPTSLLTCHVKCNDNYDFHQLPQTHYICDLRGAWNLKTGKFWPDCTRKYYPDRALLKGQGQYFYFRGKCEDSKTQIALTFKNYLQTQSWKVCGQELCSVEDVQVFCGESSRKKRGVNQVNASTTSSNYGPSRRRREAEVENPSLGGGDSQRRAEFHNGSQEVLRKLFLMSENEFEKWVENKDLHSTTAPATRGTTPAFDRGEAPSEAEVETSTKIFALNKRQVSSDSVGPEVPEYIDDSFDDQYDVVVDRLINQTESGQLDGYNSSVSDANPDSVSWIQDHNENNKVRITFEVIKKTQPGQEVDSVVQSELIQQLYVISDALSVALAGFNLSVPDNSSGVPPYDNGTAGNGTSGGLLVSSHTSFEDPVIRGCSVGHVGQTEAGSTLKCMACPPGTYHDLDQDTCEPCHIHTYQPEEGKLHCISCPDGTSTERTGSDNISLCAADCVEGEYSLSGFAPCIPCPLHTYNSMVASRTCFPCTLNKKTLRLGAKSSSECIDPCSPGSFSDTGLVPCLQCPRGSYNAEHGATSCYPCEQWPSTPVADLMDNDSCEGWDPCRDNNTECQNNGTCRVNGNLAFCECASGYAGASCELNVDDCTDQVCLNGATCVDGVNNFTCVCTLGHTGKYCEVDLDECLSSPCRNGGSCLDKVDSYECYCPRGYTGRRCEVQAIPCATGRCVHGACANSTNGEARCICHPGYSGPSCNVTYDLCSTHPCLHASQCVSAPGNYTCICSPGFRGVNCDFAIDHCTSSPCHEGATCISLTTGFLCKCPGGWTETLCDSETIPDADLLFNSDNEYGHYVSLPRELMPTMTAFTLSAWLRPLPLASFATIVSGVLPPQQSPRAGDASRGDLETVFAVRHTDKLIITFFEDSFTTNASLSPYVWTHLCVAWSSNTGLWSVSINGSAASSGEVSRPLKPIPANAFLVIGQQNPYYAEAEQTWDVYTGEISQFNVFGRVLSRDGIAALANQSQCNQTYGDVVSWTEVLYYARVGAIIREHSRCLDLNECFFPDAFPCPVNRECQDGIGWYNCTDCVEGYTGPNCTEPDDECLLGDRCFSGACVDGPELFDFKCICSPGYTGFSCNVRIDECLSNPCQNGGTCNLTQTTFICRCPEPNMGPLCESPSSPCLSKPCRNNGTCLETNSPGVYACTCREHFTGRNCERQLGWCEENVCLNGATCVGGSATDAGHCLCREGWTGRLCGVRVAPSCDLSPCVDGGTCVPASEAVDGYVCRCRSRPGVSLDKNCAAPNPCEAMPCPSTHVCVFRGASYTCECLKPGCQPWSGGGHDNSTAEPTPYNNMKHLKDYWLSSDWVFTIIAGTAVLLVLILVVTVYFCRKKKTASVDLEVFNSSPAVALGHMTNPGFLHDEGLDQESTYAELSDEYNTQDNVYEDQADVPNSLTTPPGTRKLPASRTSSGSSSGSFSSIRPYLSEKLRKSNETSRPLLYEDYLEPLAVKNGKNAQSIVLPSCAMKNDGRTTSGGDGLLNPGFNPDDYLIPEVDRLAKSAAQVAEDKQCGAATHKKTEDTWSAPVYANSHGDASDFVASDFVLEDYVIMDSKKRGPAIDVRFPCNKTDKQTNIYTNLKAPPLTHQNRKTEVNMGYGRPDGPTSYSSNPDGEQKPLPVDNYFIPNNQDDTSVDSSKQNQTQEKVTLVDPAIGVNAPSLQNYVPFLDVLEQSTENPEGHIAIETPNPSQMASPLDQGVTGLSIVSCREDVPPPPACPGLASPFMSPPMLPYQSDVTESDETHDDFVLEDFTTHLDSKNASKKKKKSKTANDKPVLKDFSDKKGRPKKENPLFLDSSALKPGSAVGSGIKSKSKNVRQATVKQGLIRAQPGTKGRNQAIQKRSLPPLPSEDVLDS